MLSKMKLLMCSAALAVTFAMAPATAAEIDRDATVTMAWAGPMSSLDPHVVPGLADQIYTFLMYDRLVNLDSAVQLQPMLAKSWKVAEDGRSLTLMLRDDVLFHDGTQFNAAAVKANIERGKTLEASTVKNALSSIESVEVVGDYEVKLNLVAGKGGELLPLLASTAGAMISPKAIADGRDLRLSPGDAGSGAYMPTTARPSDTVIFERSPVKYWDTAAGNLKQLEVRFVTQAAARLNGIRAGQFDVAQILGGDMAAAKKLAEGGTIAAHEAQTSNIQGMVLRGDRPNLTNVKLRQAIVHAIDRQAISDAVFGGNCKPTSQGLVDTHWAYNKDLDGFSNYDPEKAAALVKESGIANPSFDLVFSPGTSWEPQANIIQGMLAKVGIDAKLTPMPQQDGLTAVRNGQVDAYVYVLVATVDPSSMVESLFTSGYNLASGEMKTQIADMASKALDPKQTPEQRAAIYGEIFKIGAENALYFPICASKVVWAHKKNLVGVEDAWWYFSSLPDFRNIAVTK
jgi:peptide/nickel transport system substrate-binding protein